jgi:hypothetical protein
MGYRYYFPWPQSQVAGVPWMVVRQEEQLNVATGGSARGHKSNTETQLPLLPTAYDGGSLGHASQNAPAPYYDPGNPMELQAIPPANAYSNQPHAI